MALDPIATARAQQAYQQRADDLRALEQRRAQQSAEDRTPPPRVEQQPPPAARTAPEARPTVNGETAVRAQAEAPPREPPAPPPAPNPADQRAATTPEPLASADNTFTVSEGRATGPQETPTTVDQRTDIRDTIVEDARRRQASQAYAAQSGQTGQSSEGTGAKPPNLNIVS